MLERCPWRDRHGFAQWVCRCDCGTHRSVLVGSLVRGLSRSCGCLKAEVARERALSVRLIHGDALKGRRRGLYQLWASMIQRCTNPKHQAWKNYGGRGIRVCDHWKRNYMAFKFWMGERPSAAYTVDRIDNDGHYEPGNIRWATRTEQVRNRSRGASLVEEG